MGNVTHSSLRIIGLSEDCEHLNCEYFSSWFKPYFALSQLNLSGLQVEMAFPNTNKPVRHEIGYAQIVC
jgi:hypothetical protein